MAQDDLRKFLQGCESLFDEQDSNGWTSHWREIRDYILPDRGRFLDEKGEAQSNRGEKRRQEILSSVGENAIANLAAGLKSYLTTPSRPWFKLRLAAQASSSHEINLWLDEVEQALHRIYNKSNFYDSLHNTYIEFAGFGTGAMLIEDDPIDIIRCSALTIGEYAFSVDDRNRIDRFVRRTYFTVDQLVSKFGLDRVSPQVKQAYEKERWSDKFCVYHVVSKNQDLPEELTVDKPWASCYYEKGKYDKPLDVGGFFEFPYIVLRWNTISTDVYGTECPGMKELANIKQLYDMVEKKLIAVHKMVEPPVVANGHVDYINTLPGGVSQAPGTAGGQMGLQPLYLIKPDIPAINDSLATTIEEIRTGFFNHLFLMISSDESDRKTAFEVARLQEEKMSMLGPVVENINTAGLDSAIERTFQLVVRNDPEFYILPEPPPEMEGAPIDVEYISLLAQAQKTSGLRSLDSFMAFVFQAAQLDPSIVDNINLDEQVRYYQDGTGAPEIAIYSREEVASKRQAKQALQNLQAALTATSGVADAAAKFGKAPIGNHNALEGVLAGGAENLAP